MTNKGWAHQSVATFFGLSFGKTMPSMFFVSGDRSVFVDRDVLFSLPQSKRCTLQVDNRETLKQGRPKHIPIFQMSLAMLLKANRNTGPA